MKSKFYLAFGILSILITLTTLINLGVFSNNNVRLEEYSPSNSETESRVLPYFDVEDFYNSSSNWDQSLFYVDKDKI